MRHLTAIILALGILLAGAAAGAAERPVWWETASQEAAEDGYRVIGDQELDQMLRQSPPPLIIDVRPDYEYERSHIPGAKNLEFHLGDRLRLSQEKEEAFADLVGPDKSRPVILYCRSFKCLRSGIAARWAARLGYTGVLRYVAGWHGWLAHTGQVAPDEPPKGLAVGDFFPSCQLVVLEGDRDREYLGLAPGAKRFSLGEVDADYLFVELYSHLCYGCLQEVSSYNDLYRSIQADPFLSERLRIMGMGVGSTYRVVRRFRREQGVLFPLFADQHKGVFTCLGQPALPVAYVLKRVARERMRILNVIPGHIGDTEAVLARIRAAVAASPP